MPTPYELKEQTVTDTPVLLFECRLRSGVVERWSTHSVGVNGTAYAPRILKHNLFEIGAFSEDGVDGVSRVSVTLANADSYYSQIERATGFKGAKLVVKFVFADLIQGLPASDAITVFTGVANPPDEMSDSGFRLSFVNRLSPNRLLLPDLRIQKRCPWLFPSTNEQRQEAVHGNDKGKYSRFFRCGYSPDVAGGSGTLDGDQPYVDCNYTRSDCMARGMFDKDAAGTPTRRFGGIGFVPASILVRSFGDRSFHVSPLLESQAKYNDFVPLVYGRVWYQPAITFARNDGNLTHMEVLLGIGEMHAVEKVAVNDIEIPLGRTGTNMTATGWFNIVTLGNRTGAFNLDFTDGSATPIGDPYGSMAVLSVVVPNRVADGKAMPKISVLADGIKLSRFGIDGGYLDEAFSNNPTWILLDVLRRCGWDVTEVDTASFAQSAAFCDEEIDATDLNGNPTTVPRFQCNMALKRRKSAAEVIRGIRNAASLLLGYGQDGKLQLRPESSLAVQQSEKPQGSNSSQPLDGGWPSYEFGDGTSGVSGILRRGNGEPSFRLRSRSTADTPNRLSIEFQDEFNEFQQDSLSLLDFDDIVSTGQEISASLNALGVPNFSQAARVIRLHLNKSIRGNTIVEFETSVRGLGVRPGDIITITYLREGFQRMPFRVTRIAPALNYGSALITAHVHDDSWYSDAHPGGTADRRQPSFEVSLPKPIVGKTLGPNGESILDLGETSLEGTDGSIRILLSVGFVEPRHPLPSGVSIPLVSLSPVLDSGGGTLQANRTLYYAVTAIAEGGAESRPSFLVRAVLPPGLNTYAVTLRRLSFGSGTIGFSVYRGKNPEQLLRIADTHSVASTFIDTGTNEELASLPDEHFDHANVYWRMEQLGETSVDIFDGTSVGNSSLQLLENEQRGMAVRIVAGKGAGQERTIISNTPTILTVAFAWDIIPDGTSVFVIAESAWHFGAMGRTSPIEIEVPNREGATVHVSVRSANVADKECALELSPVTRWRISGGQGFILDSDIPPAPVFGLYSAGQGGVELLGVSFTDFLNTRTVSAATLHLWYWDELNSPSSVALSAGIDETVEHINISPPGEALSGGVIQLGGEVMTVLENLEGGAVYRVERGSFDSGAWAHSQGEPVYHLDRRVYIAPFPRDFFGSPASGSYSYPISLQNARIAAAEMFMTNIHGDGPSTKRAFTATTEEGLRTLSGGQLSIQVEGYLAIQNDVAPPLVLESSHSVRDVFAVVREAPTEAPIQLRLRQNDVTYCLLTIGVGETLSEAVDGFDLQPLASGSQLSLDIVSLAQTSTANPGSDLTVTIRL